MNEEAGTAKTPPSRQGPGFIAMLDEVAANFPGRGSSKKHTLFLLIRSHYKTDDDFNTLKAIATPKLVFAIYPPGELSPGDLKKHIALKRKSFSSLKSSLNKTLRSLIDSGLNPSGIVLNKLNLFTFSSEKEESKLPRSVEEPLLNKLSKLLSKEGLEVGEDIEKKLGTLLRRELSLLRKNIQNHEARKNLPGSQDEALKTELDKKEKEISRLSEKLQSLETELEEAKPSPGKEAPGEAASSPEPEVSEKFNDDPLLLERLASAIKEGLKKEIDQFQSTDTLLHQKQERLSSREKQLLESIEKLAQKEIELARENLRHKESLEAAARQERELYEKELNKLKSQAESLLGEKERLLDEQIELQKSFDSEKREEADLALEAHKKLSQERRKVNERAKELLDAESKFHKEREFARKGFVVKEENIQKMAADQMLQEMDINEAKSAFEQEKNEFREESQKKFDDDLNALKSEFKEQKKLLDRERLDVARERKRLDQGWDELERKESDAGKRLEERIKKESEKRSHELEKRERELEGRIEKISQEEKLLQEDKKNIVEKLSAGIGGKTSLLKLRELVKNQEALMSQKHSLMESEESFRKRVYSSLKAKSDSMRREIEEGREALKRQTGELEKTRESLNNRESRIIEEKNRALTEYREKYEKLLENREEEFRKKEEEFGKKNEELTRTEGELLGIKRSLQEKESDLTLDIAEKNDEASALFKENLKTKKRLQEREKEIIEESAAVNSLFQEKSSCLKERYDKKFSDLKTLHQLNKEKERSHSEKGGEAHPYGFDPQQLAFEQKQLEARSEFLERSFLQLNDKKEEISQLKNEVASLTAEREDSISGESGALNEMLDDKLGEIINHLLSGSPKTEGAPEISADTTGLHGKEGLASPGFNEGAGEIQEPPHTDSGAKSSSGRGSPDKNENGSEPEHSGEGEGGGGSLLTGENEQGLRFGPGGSKELKLSTEAEKEGAPITFGEDNLPGKKSTGDDLASQIVQFNGNIEEFATSPAFLKAIAQKYNISHKISAGDFEMGCDSYPDSAPRHEVKVNSGFIMSKFPVTNLQFLQFVKETDYTTSVEKKLVTPISTRGGKKNILDKKNRVVGYEDKNISFVMDSFSSFRNPFGKQSNIADKYGHPVIQVTWYDALAYCKWLSETTGKTFRLPTEAEWEYVATEGGRITPEGFLLENSELLSKRYNFSDSLISDTTPVDYYPENRTGVSDMMGNVWEWTSDSFTCYPGSSGKADSLRDDFMVSRGFGFIDPYSKANFWIRRPVKPMTATSYIGFRVVCEEDPSEEI